MKTKRSPRPKEELTLEALQAEAASFARQESEHYEPSLFGVTDGKAVGTYLEHKFTAHLMDTYSFAGGNSASGIDIPSINVDIKVTSERQPQSSCPFKSARQKIYGLGYHLIVFVYDKTDKPRRKSSRLTIKHTIFIDASRTADFQTTKGILDILAREGNEDDLLAFIAERHLPVDEIEAQDIARDLIRSPPALGYLTISNALQWRLQYQRIITNAGKVEGIVRIHSEAE